MLAPLEGVSVLLLVACGCQADSPVTRFHSHRLFSFWPSQKHCGRGDSSGHPACCSVIPSLRDCELPAAFNQNCRGGNSSKRGGLWLNGQDPSSLLTLPHYFSSRHLCPAHSDGALIRHHASLAALNTPRLVCPHFTPLKGQLLSVHSVDLCGDVPRPRAESFRTSGSGT